MEYRSLAATLRNLQSNLEHWPFFWPFIDKNAGRDFMPGDTHIGIVKFMRGVVEAKNPTGEVTKWEMTVFHDVLRAICHVIASSRNSLRLLSAEQTNHMPHDRFDRFESERLFRDGELPMGGVPAWVSYVARPEPRHAFWLIFHAEQSYREVAGIYWDGSLDRYYHEIANGLCGPLLEHDPFAFEPKDCIPPHMLLIQIREGLSREADLKRQLVQQLVEKRKLNQDLSAARSVLLESRRRPYGKPDREYVLHEREGVDRHIVVYEVQGKVLSYVDVEQTVCRVIEDHLEGESISVNRYSFYWELDLDSLDHLSIENDLEDIFKVSLDIDYSLVEKDDAIVEDAIHLICEKLGIDDEAVEEHSMDELPHLLSSGHEQIS